jgi:acylphosphatase
MTAIARKFLVSGRVQGVGFRFFAQRAAARHQVRGYVRNLDDGRVEAVAQGPAEQVRDFGEDLVAGPTYSQVEAVEELVIDVEKTYSSFRIER